MANNRMYLVHKPSGVGIMLGKRMGWGWYQPPSEERMRAFYDYLSNDLIESRQDDFVLYQEDAEGSECYDDWSKAETNKDGYIQFK